MTAMTPYPPLQALALKVLSCLVRRVARAAPAWILGLAVAGCAVGPDYRRPEVETPAAFRHAEGWKAAEPADTVGQGPWWRLYRDPVLDGLQARLDAANQTLAQAQAQYRLSQALARGARAAFSPALGASAGKTRSGRGGAGGGAVRLPDGSTVATGGGGGVDNSYDLSFAISWEMDLWGRLRRQLEAETAGLQASAADLAAARLSLQSELALNYLQLRVLDEQKRLLDATVAAYQRSLRLTGNQYEAGIVPKSDVTQALAQLRGAQAQAIDLVHQRAQLEHAIAVLVGVPPAAFRLAEEQGVPELPGIPALLPSELLERRPDVASAERQVMAANAAIGVAQSAWFPSLELSAAGGWRSGGFASWISAPNRFWSIGPQFAMALFDGGLIRSRVEQAEASYDRTVGFYRQTVLDSFREVEDFLVQLRVLEEEAGVQRQALEAARESLRLLENQYQAGTIDYNDVVNVQTAALNSERASLALLGSRLAASVRLIAALGGGWEGASLERLSARD